jgi:hypothetical protein
VGILTFAWTRVAHQAGQFLPGLVGVALSPSFQRPAETAGAQAMSGMEVAAGGRQAI